MTDCRFPKKPEYPDMFRKLSLPVAEAIDGGFRGFIGVSVKVSGLERPAC